MPQKNALSDNHLLGHPVRIEYRLLFFYIHLCRSLFTPSKVTCHQVSWRDRLEGDEATSSVTLLLHVTTAHCVFPKETSTRCVRQQKTPTMCVVFLKQLHSVCLKETTTLCVPQRNSYTLCFAKKQLHCMFPGETASLCVSLNKTVPMCVPH